MRTRQSNNRIGQGPLKVARVKLIGFYLVCGKNALERDASCDLFRRSLTMTYDAVCGRLENTDMLARSKRIRYHMPFDPVSARSRECVIVMKVRTPESSWSNHSI